MKGLQHIGVYTHDLEMSIRFYTEVMGFTLDTRAVVPMPDYDLKIAFVSLGTCVLELLQPGDGEEVKCWKKGAVEHYAIDVDDIRAEMAKLKAKGVVFETDEPLDIPMIGNGVEAVFFFGPSGEHIELCHAK